jgi:putative two-component system response regulator
MGWEQIMQNEKKIVFLVDDDMTNLTVGKKVLDPYYKVFIVQSADVMFDLLEGVTPDLILLDVNMPGTDGHAAIERLKKNADTASIPVIFLTALANEQMEILGLSLGAIDYITKPFSAPLLLKRIEIHLLVEAQKRELIMFNDSLSQMVDEKTATVVELKNAILATMAELVEYRDKITGGHIMRTQLYIRALLHAMKAGGIYGDQLAEMDEDLLITSCQLHDVGKIAVKDEILNKPDKLTPEEFDSIKSHTIFGEKVIERLKEKTMDSDFLEYARIFAISHHEKWDGSGYPHGLTGEEIPLLGRMMAIGDVCDALVEPRPYKGELPHEKAMEIILEGKGGHFDPVLTDVFEKVGHVFEKISVEVKG